MNTVIVILILLISLTQNCYGQLNNGDSLINKFRSDIEIERKKHSGIFAMDDETKESYYLVIINCSIKNLVSYTNDTNAFVRSSIFDGLLRKKVNEHILLNILDLHKNDTAEFMSMSADVVTKWTVKEFMQTGMNLKSANELVDINYKREIDKIRDRKLGEIQITGLHHGLIEKKELLKCDSLIFKEKKIRVVSFVLYISEKPISSSSNILTSEMKKAIKETEPGDTLVFDEIKVIDQGEKIRKWSPIQLKLE